MDKLLIDKKIKEVLAQRRQKAELDAINYRDFVMQNSDYAALDRLLREKELEKMKLNFAGENCSQIKSQIKRLQDKKSKLEQKLNIDSRRLSPVYFCEKCNDTGKINGVMCDCVKQIKDELLHSDTSFVTQQQQFSLSAETDEENIKAIAFCQKFADAYPLTPIKNITIFGAVGTGKTFVAGCVCNRLSQRNIPCLAITAFEMANIFLKARLSFDDDKAELYDLIDAPFLIIDDLGSEPFSNNVTAEYLLTLLNERSIRNKGILVTTNLSTEKLMERYGDRVFSRLRVDKSSAFIYLRGADKRLPKKHGGKI